MSCPLKHSLIMLFATLCAVFPKGESAQPDPLLDLGGLNESTWSAAAEKGRLEKDVAPLLNGRILQSMVSKSGNYAIISKCDTGFSCLHVQDSTRTNPSQQITQTEKFAQTVKTYCGHNVFQNDIVLKDQKNKKSIHLLQYVLSYRRKEAPSPQIESATLVVFRNDYRDREEFSLWLEKQLSDKCSQFDLLDVTESLDIKTAGQNHPSAATPEFNSPERSADAVKNPEKDLLPAPVEKAGAKTPVAESVPSNTEPAPANRLDGTEKAGRFASEISKTIVSNDSFKILSVFDRYKMVLDELELADLSEILNTLMKENTNLRTPPDRLRSHFSLQSSHLVNTIILWLESSGFPVGELDPAFTRNVNGLLYVQEKPGLFWSRQKKMEDPLDKLYRSANGIFQLEMINDADPSQGYMEKYYSNILDLTESLRLRKSVKPLKPEKIK